MDKDVAVLIIHTLIKQLGMHGARSRRGEKRDSGRKISESKRPNDGERVKREERRRESALHWVFSAP